MTDIDFARSSIQEVRFGDEKVVDQVTGKKVYQGKIGFSSHKQITDFRTSAVRWRFLKREFKTKTKAEPYARDLYQRYTEMLEYTMGELEKRMIEEYEKLQVEDGDIVVVKTKEYRQDMVSRSLQKFAGALETDVLFLMVTDHEDLKKMENEFMREHGWLRWPPKWWRRMRGWLARRGSD